MEDHRTPRYEGERELIKIKAPNNTYFWEGYNSRFMIKVGNTNNYLRQYKNFNTSAEKEFRGGRGSFAGNGPALHAGSYGSS